MTSDTARLLHLRSAVPGEPDDIDAPPADDEQEAARCGAVLTLREGQVSYLDQLTGTFSHALHASRLRWRHAKDGGGIVAAMLDGKQPSIREECDYAKSRAWVPEGHAGGTSEAMGDVFHAVVGRPGVTIGNAVSYVSHRPLRFCVAAGVATVAAIAVLCALGHVHLAVEAGAGFMVLLVAWVAAAVALIAVRHRREPGEIRYERPEAERRETGGGFTYHWPDDDPQNDKDDAPWEA